MAITDRMRKAFDDCTVMAGVENDFECVYITKDAALLYLDEIDADNAKLRELLDYMTPIAWYAASERERDRMRELGIEVDA